VIYLLSTIIKSIIKQHAQLMSWTARQHCCTYNCPRQKETDKTNTMNITEEIFEIRSYIEILANDIKIYTV